MKRTIVLLTFLFLLGTTLACRDPFAAQAAQEESEIPEFIKEQWVIEAQATVRSEYYEEPDLSGFSLVSESGGLSWDCEDSQRNINGELKQRITQVGNYLEFVCKDDIAYYRLINEN